MGALPDPPIARLLLAIGLGFFLGLAFEDFNARSGQTRPGGVRTFPLLALTGALLWRLDATEPWPLCAGLLALSAWLTCFYWNHTKETDADGFPNVGLIVPVCNVLAFLLGPVALVEPAWLAVGATVTAVLFLTARDTLHGLARRIELAEIVNAGRFLLLTGFILPVLPDTPVTTLTTITPRQVWLAVVAVCSVSYASYLVRRYLAPAGADLLTAVLGGLYSSTATTVVLARRAAGEDAGLAKTRAGIVLATAIMYLRILLIVALFNQKLALALLGPLLGLSVVGVLQAGAAYWQGASRSGGTTETTAPGNPLALGTAALFAVLFVVISIASSFAAKQFGTAGVFVLAAIVGVSDIDPYVLSLAQHGAGNLSPGTGAAAILLAASSNNLLKAGYVAFYAQPKRMAGPIGALVLLAALGAVAAVVIAR